jgi:hypothetical protein
VGWLTVALGVFVTYNFFRQDQAIWTAISGVTTLINFWSYGAMHNFAAEAARRRPRRDGQFSDRDLVAVPNWLTNVNMGTAVIIGALLLWLTASQWM